MIIIIIRRRTTTRDDTVVGQKCKKMRIRSAFSCRKMRIRRSADLGLGLGLGLRGKCAFSGGPVGHELRRVNMKTATLYSYGVRR